jgi:hypothetical protein
LWNLKGDVVSARMHPGTLPLQIRCARQFVALRRLVFLVLVLAVAFAGNAVAEVRTWSARNGHRFDAELLAADGLRATLGLDGQPKWVVPLADLVAPDVEVVRTWRHGRRHRPLVDARLLAPWPVQAVAENVEVRATGEDAGQFSFESAHFRISSDVNLPLHVVRDLAEVFEATRSVVMALPIGLHAGGEREKYNVLMTGSPEAYGEAGGSAGTGGYFDARTRRMLVLLPNLGIEQRNGKFTLRYANNLFVLKHEVTHQLLARWNGPMPYWLHEGLPEFIASLPYGRGRYALQNPTAGLRDYLLKWRKGPNDRTVAINSPARLMAMRSGEWNRAMADGAAYHLYNTAGLLTHHFIQQRNGAAIAGYLEALRRGVGPEDAEKEFLLPEGGRESLSGSVISLGRRIGVEVKLIE